MKPHQNTKEIAEARGLRMKYPLTLIPRRDVSTMSSPIRQLSPVTTVLGRGSASDKEIIRWTQGPLNFSHPQAQNEHPRAVLWRKRFAEGVYILYLQISLLEDPVATRIFYKQTLPKIPIEMLMITRSIPAKGSRHVLKTIPKALPIYMRERIVPVQVRTVIQLVVWNLLKISTTTDWRGNLLGRW